MLRDEALRALCDAATPGPWRVDRGGVVYIDEETLRRAGATYLIRAQVAMACGIPDDVPDEHVTANAAFIAAAREALPALLDRVQKVEADNAELIAMLDRGMQLVDDSRVAKVAKLREALTAMLAWHDEVYPEKIFDGSSGDEGPLEAVRRRNLAREALAAVDALDGGGGGG